MKQKKRLLVALTRHTVLPAFFLFLAFNVSAQRTITGTVTGPDKKPVVGASVIVKGTTVGTTTNEQGVFSITVPANHDVLIITYVEYEVNEVTVTGNTVEVSMREKDITQNEVVVVGYGTQRRTNVTGAVSSVNNKTLNEYPVLSVAQALQGRVPGVTVTNNGSPGTDPIVRIRGISSISFASDPLFVVDGFPTGNLATIDTRDIETVDVLKDA
ncbi:MAG TPA: TonB-dependent receptor plug domain-containing protein, partial [Chitinophagaceae bacterium]|nr:TonB-dependent receptor plug domain-containing protein [Chitinophagaceae bacterium]